MKTKNPIRKQKTVPCFSDLLIPKEVLLGEVGLSQSLLTTAMQCDRQLVYALNRWEKPGKEQNTFFGTCAHQLMDVFYTLGQRPDEKMLEEALEDFLAHEQEQGKLDWLNPVERAYQECILLITMDEYFNFYEDDFQMDFIEVEKKFKVRYNGLTLVGKKDGKVRMKDKRILLQLYLRQRVTSMKMLSFETLTSIFKISFIFLLTALTVNLALPLLAFCTTSFDAQSLDPKERKRLENMVNDSVVKYTVTSTISSSDSILSTHQGRIRNLKKSSN